LYERNAGRVFAYCYVRVGSRNVAEWAVTATFDRAQAALANGGLPEQELDWLLRTADKFCAPRLRLRDSALADPGAVVLDDWDGLTFDQIASRLEASRQALERARGELSPWRRILGAFNLTPLVSWLKAALAGASAVQTGAVVVAITGAVVVVGTPVGDRLHDAVRPSKSKPSTPASKAPEASRSGRAHVSLPGTTSGAVAKGDRPVAAGKAKVKGTPNQAVTAAHSGAGTSISATPPSGPGSETSSPASAPTHQPAPPAGSSNPLSSRGPGTPTPTPTSTPPLPSGSVPTAPAPAPTLPIETPTVDSSPLPAPPPTPDPADPGGVVPTPPTLPPTPTVAGPTPPALPQVPSPPKLPDPPKLP
jgi:hypothetical protein